MAKMAAEVCPIARGDPKPMGGTLAGARHSPLVILNTGTSAIARTTLHSRAKIFCNT